MSLIINAKNDQFAYVENAEGKKEGSISFSDSESGTDHVELEDSFKFQLIPRPTKSSQRNTLFIAGESGSGKSFYAKQYAKQYKKMFPKNQIYLISYLDQDETLDEYKEIIRLDAFQQEFLDECLDFDLETDFKNSLVIFDDIDSVVNKKTKEKIYGFLNKLLRIGRHYNISVIYCGHSLYGSNELKYILDECQTITFFQRYLNFKKMKYLLENYFGMSKVQIERVRAIKDRSTTYCKGADKMILSDTQCFIL